MINPVVELPGETMLAPPASTDQLPVPVTGVIANTLAVVPQSVCVDPASAVEGLWSTVTVTMLLAYVQVPDARTILRKKVLLVKSVGE